MTGFKGRRRATVWGTLLAASICFGTVFASANDAATAGDAPDEAARGKEAFFSAGADLRSRWEWTHGDEPVTVGLHRLLARASLRGSTLRGDLELGWHLQNPRGDTAPALAQDALDIQQAFIDLGDAEPGAGLHQRFRVGRQELVYELLGWRDAPNVRRPWDGARFTARLNGWTNDLFALRAVEPNRGAFDDRSSPGTHVIGAHVQSTEDRPLSISAFFYDVGQSTWQTSQMTAPARTSTLGGVLTLTHGPYEASVGGALQRGDHGDRDVHGWYSEAEVGRSFSTARLTPKIAVRVSAFSGGAPQPGRVRTFNPLFPNYAYSTEAALQAPSNLIKVAVIAEAGSEDRLQLEYRGESLSRYSSRDAFYLPAGQPPLMPHTTSRWAGLQQQLKLTYAFKPEVRLTAAYVNFQAARSLRAAGATNVNYLMMQMEMGL